MTEVSKCLFLTNQRVLNSQKFHAFCTGFFGIDCLFADIISGLRY